MVTSVNGVAYIAGAGGRGAALRLWMPLPFLVDGGGDGRAGRVGVGSGEGLKLAEARALDCKVRRHNSLSDTGVL